jgi:hypothetical protein
MKKINKTPKKFYCEKCDFLSSNKKDYNRHILTRKHNMDNNDKERITKKPQHICVTCGKGYKYASGLSKHKKKCNVISKKKKNTINISFRNKKIIDPEKESLKEEVAELKKMMKQMLKSQANQNTNLETLKDVIPNGGNTYNNKMSINIYLNEKCKDAMNLTDFVQNVKVSLEDILYTKNHGFVKGINNIFVKQLQDMEPTQRPIHCSDKKRMQFYVKDSDKWEKDSSHEKIDKSIDQITFKQIKLIKLWEKEHPNYLENDTLLKEWQTMIRNMTGNPNVNDIKDKSSIKRELSSTLEFKNELIDKKI